MVKLILNRGALLFYADPFSSSESLFIFMSKECSTLVKPHSKTICTGNNTQHWTWRRVLNLAIYGSEYVNLMSSERI